MNHAYLCAALLSLTIPLSLNASVLTPSPIIGDDFDAVDGTALAGTITPVGNVAWDGGGTSIWNGGVTPNTNDMEAYASVALPDADYTALSIEASIDPSRFLHNWVGIGFSSAASGGSALYTTGVVWGMVRAQPQAGDWTNWVLFVNGTSIVPGVGYASLAEGPNAISLTYDEETTWLTFTINGSVVYDSATNGIDIDNFKAAAFHLNYQLHDETQPQITNFEVYAAIPEPTAYVCTLLGMVVIFGARKQLSGLRAA